ncbi:enamine deaminase RidA (YjgF/YER057c/UK114 family) [Actinophytocola algeriensis]|uniref:Enamine deaminase RidA (YjgF/YER057c/UK114 family) n=1 Tax=Actinophytocola algeriensis TaxID=1768010 RepID=A0A7W7Q7A3_9PSEU|nr:enamine deaminase RidA (YjgF/YER057c/UK114 family) [Actinophytocola algeriensis]MBE1475248.1 enamine deaminase RidA (YjgF/YER057c/UK114 family) [Actinophytocola algeriensis]
MQRPAVSAAGGPSSRLARRAADKLGATPVPPGTLIGVAALDVPEHLVEVEATAVVS